MKNKLLLILLILPFILGTIIFVGISNISLPIELGVSRIILEHENFERVKLSDNLYPLYAYSIPRGLDDTLSWSVSDDTKAEIVDGRYLKGKEEGMVEVSVKSSTSNATESFNVYFYNDTDYLQDILLFDDSSNELHNKSFKYGEFSFDSSLNTVNGSTTLKALAIPEKFDDSLSLKVKDGDATLEDNTVTFNSGDDVVIEAMCEESDVTKELTLDVVPNGYNVYTYDELIECTNKSKNGKIVCLRVNFESRENSFKVLDEDDSEENLFPNTQVFGRHLNKDIYQHDIVKKEGRYDLTYFNNLKELGETKDTTVKIGIYVQEDFYGNGFTINTHELTFPSLTIANNKPYPGKSDIFKGPLSFVRVGTDIYYVEVFGEDNASMYVCGDDILVESLNIKSCNEVTDLTHLDYVGTTLEVVGDNVTISNSSVSNGRICVRSFSNKNTLLDNVYLYNAREFLLKVGSNEFEKPEEGKNLGLMTDDEKKKFLSPVPKDITGENSNITVKDCTFYQSGFFSIGIDTHFAGEILYGGTEYSLPGVNNLAGTSNATRLKITGNTKFYDWKKVSSLDSSSLISASDNAIDLVKQMFDIQKLVREYINNVNPDLGITYEDELYVHGGIAYYGGGKNYSIDNLYLDESIDNSMSEIKDMVVTGLPSLASGPHPFYFRLYSSSTENNLFNELPTFLM